jgi:hypothetical protein
MHLDARQPKRLQRQHTHPSTMRHPRLPTPPPLHFGLLRTACAPTSTHSNGFCVIWGCVSSSSSSYPKTRGVYLIKLLGDRRPNRNLRGSLLCVWCCPRFLLAFLEKQPPSDRGVLSTQGNPCNARVPIFPIARVACAFPDGFLGPWQPGGRGGSYLAIPAKK